MIGFEDWIDLILFKNEQNLDLMRVFISKGTFLSVGSECFSCFLELQPYGGESGWNHITERGMCLAHSQGMSIYGVMNCEFDTNACTQQAGGSNLILSPATMNCTQKRKMFL